MKKRKKEIKAVIFDVGGVLALGKDLGQLKSVSRGVHEKIARALGISTDQWFDTIGEKYNKTITGEIKEKEFLNYLSKIFKRPPKFIKSLFLKNYSANYKQNSLLYKFAFGLKNKGYRIGILSDQHSLSKEATLPPSKIRLFNSVILSCDLGFRKPSLKIYQAAIEKLNVKPEEALFIDNQTWNLKPAKKLGMYTILFKNNKQLFKQLKRLGVNV